VALVLNASSQDRGIATIKGKIAQFSNSKPPKGKIKIIFLDEADGLTPDAQLALKNTIEKNAKTARFIMTSNYREGIIPPILSRLMQFEFTQLPMNKVVKYCSGILKSEKVSHKPKDIRKIVSVYYPDIRSIVNEMQLRCEGERLKISDDVLKAFSFTPSNIQDLIFDGKLGEIRRLVSGVVDFNRFYTYLFDNMIVKLKGEEYRDNVIADVSLSIAEYMYRDAMVVLKDVNFAAMCIDLMSIIHGEDVEIDW